MPIDRSGLTDLFVGTKCTHRVTNKSLNGQRVYEIFYEGSLVALALKISPKRSLFYVKQVDTFLENYFPLEREYQATTMRDLCLRVGEAIDKAKG
ncbi:MAG: hypothetical protein GDA41_12625 [Rhodospirillales bacterium]|nr:hypothetical protein [Rhodospirillales bacterium]